MSALPQGPGPLASGGRDRVDILGVAIDDLSYEEAIATLRSAVVGPEPRTLFFANAHTLELACRLPSFRRVLSAADFLFGDGTGVRWAARINGLHMRANLNGTDLIPAFMRAANDDGLRYYLLGATPAVVERTADVMRRRFPGWVLTGFHHGYLDAAATDRLVEAIDAASPNLLLVAMGNPIQECWIAANRGRLSVNLVAGVGGLFAYLSGDYRRAPAGMRRFGLEWLAVLVTQRFKWQRYVVGAPVFLGRVVAGRLSRGRHR